jgi:hypothetical protein
MPSRHVLKALIAFLIAAAGLVGAIIGESTADPQPRTVEAPAPTGPSGPTFQAPAAVPVDTADKGTAPDDVIELGSRAQKIAEDVAADPEAYDFAVADELSGTVKGPVGVVPGPLATAHVPGCTTRFLPTNFSSRVESVEAVGLHYTAGANAPGLADMNGLTAFASSSSAGVSWHFLIDAEGHCYYSVPLSMKAWTIGDLNSDTVNIEVIQRGDEPTYPADSPGARKLARVVNYVLDTYQLGEPRVGSVAACEVTAGNIITHWQGGVCAGAHGDIRPYEITEVVAAIAAAARVKITDADRKACKAIIRYRHRRKGDDNAARRQTRKPANQARQQARVRDLHARGLYCTKKSRVKRSK